MFKIEFKDINKKHNDELNKFTDTKGIFEKRITNDINKFKENINQFDKSNNEMKDTLREIEEPIKKYTESLKNEFNVMSNEISRIQEIQRDILID